MKEPFDPPEVSRQGGRRKTILTYRKDQIVFSQGDVADAVFYIQQGNIKFNVVSELGKEAVVAILGPSQFFGEGCLNDASDRRDVAAEIELVGSLLHLCKPVSA